MKRTFEVLNNDAPMGEIVPTKKAHVEEFSMENYLDHLLLHNKEISLSKDQISHYLDHFVTQIPISEASQLRNEKQVYYEIISLLFSKISQQNNREKELIARLGTVQHMQTQLEASHRRSEALEEANKKMELRIKLLSAQLNYLNNQNSSLNTSMDYNRDVY